MTDSSILNIIRLCEKGKMLNASDLHIVGDVEARFRINGDLSKVDDVYVSNDEITKFIDLVANDVQKERYQGGFIDFAYQEDSFGRVRVSGSRSQHGMALAIRFLPTNPKPFDTLLLPDVIRTFADAPKGLVIMSGQTGSGKTTLLASLVDHVIKTSTRRVITFEDPIEYVFESAKGMITQYEVGLHIRSYEDGLRGVMRADPEVIVCGEVRDTETANAVLALAETGHLVFCTIHASEAGQVPDRLLNLFSADKRNDVTSRLAQTLVGVVAMNLVKMKDGKSRRAAVEILVGTSNVRAIIAKGQTAQLRNSIQTGANDGMQTLEMHLRNLIKADHISVSEAKSVSIHHEDLELTASRSAA